LPGTNNKSLINMALDIRNQAPARPAWVDLSIAFQDSDRSSSGITERTLRVWRWTAAGGWDTSSVSGSSVDQSANTVDVNISTGFSTFAPLGRYISEVVDVENEDPEVIKMFIPPPLLTCAAGGHLCCQWGCNGTHYGIHDDSCPGEMTCCKECGIEQAKAQEVTIMGEDLVKLTGKHAMKQITEEPVTIIYVAAAGAFIIMGAIVLLIKSV